MSTGFTGFPPQGVEFLRQLKENNKKSWFEANRDDFEKYLLEPSRLFVLDMGERLRSIVPNIQFIPKTDKSLFRIYRDVRFSKDKSPYKTNIGIWFWEGDRKKLENSGFYFHLEGDHMILACGLYQLPPDLLEQYRRAVDNDISGKQMVKAVNELEQHVGYHVHTQALKRVPRGYDPEHPRARFLKYKGFGPMLQLPITETLHTPQFLDMAFDVYNRMLPLHQWLVRYVTNPPG